MDTDQIKKKLNDNRKKLLLKDTKSKIDILATIKVADEGSHHFNEKIAIIKKAGEYYFKEYTKDLPTSVLNSFKLSKQEATIMISVMNDYTKYKHYHINPYTWLICGCLYKGLDLIKENLLEL